MFTSDGKVTLRVDAKDPLAPFHAMAEGIKLYAMKLAEKEKNEMIAVASPDQVKLLAN